MVTTDRVAFAVFNMQNNIKFMRTVDVSSFGVLTAELCKYEKHFLEAHGLSVECIRIQPTPGNMRAHTEATPLRFTMICGKIVHWRMDSIHNENVKCFVRHHSDGFGHFQVMYTIGCNFITSRNNDNTLFRAGCDSVEIDKMVKLVFTPNSVKACFAHLIIANARLGYAVHLDSPQLDHAMQQCPHWRTDPTINNDDMCYLKGFRIHSFNQTWFNDTFGVELLVPHRILINVSKKGHVNIFVNLNANTRFQKHVELDFKPLFDYLLGFVQYYS